MSDLAEAGRILARARATLARLRAPPPPALTPQELKVLTARTQNHSRKQVADLLGISLGTVDSHMQSILRKTNAQDALGAVWKLGWVSLPNGRG